LDSSYSSSSLSSTSSANDTYFFDGMSKSFDYDGNFLPSLIINFFLGESFFLFGD